ncbi:MAG: ABC transporter permease [Chloroflexi bacterium]|nr:ABC transporter permease [Chloroflexota bacterium]
MDLRELLHLAWNSILANRMRSLLTMLGIIIGVAAVIVMIAVSAGTEATIEERITGLGSNLVFVTSGFSRGGPGREVRNAGLKFDDAAAIADEVSGVVAVVVEQNAEETVEVGNVAVEEVEVLGTTPGFPSVREVKLASGRYFTEVEVERKTKLVVLGTSLAQELFGQTDPIGQSVTVGNTDLTVIGVFAKRGMVSGVDFDARLYTPITVVFQKFTPRQFARFLGDQVRVIYVKVKDRATMDHTIEQIKLLLAKRHNVTLDAADFTVTTQDDIIQTQESATSAFRSLLGWVAGVSLIVGGIGIMNIMLVSVSERTREIGIRQSVGATNNDIRYQFLTEAILLSLFGGAIGVLAGAGGAVLFGAMSDMRTVVMPSSILLAFFSAALVGVFFGYYPANRAALLDPIEALRHE